MGKLNTALGLPKKILLQGWSEAQNNQDINGEYILNSSTVLFNGYLISNFYEKQGGGATIYFYSMHFNGPSWAHYSNDEGWYNSAQNQNARTLPLTEWVINNAEGAAGTITPILTDTKNISINKQNLNKLKGNNTNPDAIYVFKSATTNLLGTIFNASQFYSGIDTVQIFYQGSLSGPSNVFSANGSEWLDVITEETADNYIIPANSIIIFNSVNANLNINIGGGAVIQKYYSGKININ